jgi:hypothetical protein
MLTMIDLDRSFTRLQPGDMCIYIALHCLALSLQVPTKIKNRDRIKFNYKEYALACTACMLAFDLLRSIIHFSSQIARLELASFQIDQYGFSSLLFKKGGTTETGTAHPSRIESCHKSIRVRGLIQDQDPYRHAGRWEPSRVRSDTCGPAPSEGLKVGRNFLLVVVVIAIAIAVTVIGKKNDCFKSAIAFSICP